MTPVVELFLIHPQIEFAGTVQVEVSTGVAAAEDVRAEA
jgi:hypothetical protein